MSSIYVTLLCIAKLAELCGMLIGVLQKFKGKRIRFGVRIAINPMHRIRVFESINRIGFNAEK